MLTWSVHEVRTRTFDALHDGLAVNEAGVGDVGSFDDETFLAVPNYVLPVWRQNLVVLLWGEAGRGITFKSIII